MDEVKDEHTQVEIVRDNGVELGECVVTRCEQQECPLHTGRVSWSETKLMI